MSHTHAVEEMRRSEGQFDPQLLEMFLSWSETAEVSGRRRATPQRVATFTLGLTA
jgi:HD-GYP domain-containing protein (c-di-GMP phosphodiesterase class II)